CGAPRLHVLQELAERLLDLFLAPSRVGQSCLEVRLLSPGALALHLSLLAHRPGRVLLLVGLLQHLALLADRVPSSILQLAAELLAFLRHPLQLPSAFLCPRLRFRRLRLSVLSRFPRHVSQLGRLLPDCFRLLLQSSPLGLWPLRVGSKLLE